MDFWWGGVWILPERWRQQLQVKDCKKAGYTPEATVQQYNLQGTPMASRAPIWKEIINKYISIICLVGNDDWLNSIQNKMVQSWIRVPSQNISVKIDILSIYKKIEIF
jgi:hypothetical protein